VAGRIRQIEKLNSLIRNQTRELPTCSIVFQPAMLLRSLDDDDNNNSNYNNMFIKMFYNSQKDQLQESGEEEYY
jgi:hypothetical protein